MSNNKLTELGIISTLTCRNDIITVNNLKTSLNSIGSGRLDSIFFNKGEYKLKRTRPSVGYYDTITSEDKINSIQIEGSDTIYYEEDWLYNYYDSLNSLSPKVKKRYEENLKRMSTRSRKLDSFSHSLLSFDSYTSVVDLNDYLNYSLTGKGILQVQVLYSKTTGSDIYNHVTTFDLRTNTCEEIDELLTLEYLGGTLRLFPLTDVTDLNEYIINNCLITYDN